jgi:predicted RNase H-like HicB family nuclease
LRFDCRSLARNLPIDSSRSADTLANGIESSSEVEVLTSEYGYRVIYEPLAEGGFQVIGPALPGIVTYGRTIEEAREMAGDAIACHIKGLLKDDEQIRIDPFPAKPPITKN